MPTESDKFDEAVRQAEATRDAIRDAIENFLQAAKIVRSGLQELPPGITTRIMDGLCQCGHHGGQDAVDNMRPQSNSEKVLAFLNSKDRPQTKQQIMDGTGLSEGALKGVLYDAKHKQKFETVKAGKGKTLAWKLKSGVQA